MLIFTFICISFPSGNPFKKFEKDIFKRKPFIVFVCCNFSSVNAKHVNYFFLTMCKIYSIIKILYANNLEFRTFLKIE